LQRLVTPFDRHSQQNERAVGCSSNGVLDQSAITTSDPRDGDPRCGTLGPCGAAGFLAPTEID